MTETWTVTEEVVTWEELVGGDSTSIGGYSYDNTVVPVVKDVLAFTGTKWAATALDSSHITDFDEAVDDRVAVLVQDGNGIAWAYDDDLGTYVPTVTLNPFSTTNLAEGTNLYYTDERVDDRVNALVQPTASGGLSWAYADVAGTLTPSLAIINADVAAGAAIVASKIAAGTFGAGAYSFAGSTITDLGTVSTAAFTTLSIGAVPATGALVNLSENFSVYAYKAAGAVNRNVISENIVTAPGVLDIGDNTAGRWTSIKFHAGTLAGLTLTGANLAVAGTLGVSGTLTAQDSHYEINSTDVSAPARNFSFGQTHAFGQFDLRVSNARLGSPTSAGTAMQTWTATGTSVTGTLSVTGALTLGTGTLAAGQIGYTTADGTVIYGKGGSNYDFAILNSAGSYVAIVPTGTQNVQFLGTLLIGSTDVNLYRSAANVLKTDDSFSVTGILTLGAGNGIVSSSTADYLTFAGSTSGASGGNIVLYGSTHATQASDLSFRSDGLAVLDYDRSAARWTVTGDLTISGASAFGGSLTATASNDTTAIMFAARTSALSGQAYFGVEGSAGGAVGTGTSPYYAVVAAGAAGTGVQIGVPGGVAATFTTTNLNVATDFSVATSKFTVAAATGNTVVAGTLGVSGATTLGTATLTGGTLTTRAADGEYHTILTSAAGTTSWGWYTNGSSLIGQHVNVGAWITVAPTTFNVNFEGAVNVTNDLSVASTKFTVASATGAVTWSGDTNLYRSAANVLKTDDAFIVGGALAVNGARLTMGDGSDIYLENSGVRSWTLAPVAGVLRIQSGSGGGTVSIPADGLSLGTTFSVTGTSTLTGAVGVGGTPGTSTGMLVSSALLSGGWGDGIQVASNYPSAVVTTGIAAFNAYFVLSGVATVPAATSYLANGGAIGGATLSSYIGFHSQQWPTVTTGALTIAYGFKADGAAGTNRWGVYVTYAKSHFAEVELAGGSASGTWAYTSASDGLLQFTGGAADNTTWIYGQIASVGKLRVERSGAIRSAGGLYVVDSGDVNTGAVVFSVSTAGSVTLAAAATIAWSDVTLSRGAANRLDLGSGDSLYLSGGGNLDIGSHDNGAASAAHLTLSRNGNATTPSAGYILFVDKGNTNYYLWPDDSGLLRIHTADPTNANDTAGTVVGDQTSDVALKRDIVGWTDHAAALRAVVAAPLYRYRFLDDSRRGDKLMGGYVIHPEDRGGWWSMDDHRADSPASLDIANVLGYHAGAIKALASREDRLEDALRTILAADTISEARDTALATLEA